MTEQRSITTEAVASSKLPQDVTLVEVELLSKHADLKHANKELQGRRAWLLEMLAGKELKQSAVQETLNCTSNTQAAECTLVAVAKFEDRQVALEVYNTIAKSSQGVHRLRMHSKSSASIASQARQRALTDAIAVAKDKATLMANALQLFVGPAISVEEQSPTGGEPGVITVHIKVKFELTDN
eukprot:TRINITY_DN6625_c0_g1_i1.p1 TRINITY_DN6625_c0_g1~~TRINITY_DN6625_c0_g1_i1.p1  ORF type:complete len:183 (+),score=42.69 TRINITY_DN6625_c0_g1_i1:61-609(+)